MNKLVDFKNFVTNESVFDYKKNRLKKKIQELLLNKDHTEMFMFFTEHRDLFDTIENLSTEDMVEKLTDLLFDLNTNDPMSPFLKVFTDSEKKQFPPSTDEWRPGI